ncbi:hypothetical protein ABD91_25915 [Lysinibacillus sphaericus]|nr:hypothetical protein [Lysinibacillus sphaericus]
MKKEMLQTKQHLPMDITFVPMLHNGHFKYKTSRQTLTLSPFLLLVLKTSPASFEQLNLTYLRDDLRNLLFSRRDSNYSR